MCALVCTWGHGRLSEVLWWVLVLHTDVDFYLCALISVTQFGVKLGCVHFIYILFHLLICLFVGVSACVYLFELLCLNMNDVENQCVCV